MLGYATDKAVGVPIYIYLYERIRDDILSGHLPANYHLPSKRRLAQQLSVSVNSVQNAYAQLIAEGYVYTKEKKGYYVSPIEGHSGAVAGVSLRAEPENAPPQGDNYSIDLGAHNAAIDFFPISVLSKLLRQTLSSMKERILQPTPYNGAAELRRAIADYLYRMRGMPVTEQQIVIGASAEYLYALLMLLLGQENVYAVEDPGYPKPAQVYTANHADVQYIRMDEGGISISALLQSGANVAHILPSHHFPTGKVTTIQRRHELLEWANATKSRYIVEDDYDSEFRLSGKPIQPIYSLDDGQKVIYINTFSKTIGPSIGISYMVLPEPLCRIYKEKFGEHACTVPGLEQYAVAAFIEGGYLERHISRAKNVYRSYCNHLVDAIRQSPFGDICTAFEEDAGLHFLLKINSRRSDAEIVALAGAQGLRLASLSDYAHVKDTKYSNQFILNYSSIDFSKLPEAFERLWKAFRS